MKNRTTSTPFSLLAAVAALLLSLASTAPAALADELAQELFPCRIDRVDGEPVKDGFLVVTGWAADPSGVPVQKVELALDNALSGEVDIGGYRPDVLQHFSRPDYLWAGWTGTIALKNVTPGSHHVRAVAVSRRGKRANCGSRKLQIPDAPTVSLEPSWRIATGILLRTLAFLFWLGLIGWFPARLVGTRPVVLSAPLLGLALFAIFAEAGSALKLRPFYSALALTVVSGLALLGSTFSRHRRFRPLGRTAALTFVCCVALAAIGVIPLASHGEGAVLGNIDDAIRECSVADSISQFGWRVPPDVRGYLATIPANMRDAHIRLGGSYLLSALGDAFALRAHAVYSVAMLAAGILIVLATGLLALRVLRTFPARRWLAPTLVAFNSTLLATLYGQHFGNLLSVALMTAFLSQLLVLIRSRLARSVWPVALTASAAFTLYPETTPAWGVAALLSLGIVSPRRRVRAVQRIAVAALLAVVLNPFGLAHAEEFLARMTSRQPTPQSLGMSSAYNRLLTGDTHYFPRLTVVAGLEAYREDAPAPTGTVRAILIPVACILILATVLAGWARLTVGQRWLVAALALPVAGALAWTYWLTFPYGFAKLLPLAVPTWITAFVLLASRAAEEPNRSRFAIHRVVSYSTLLLIGVLVLPAARHVVLRATRAVPSYDPAFRALPRLAANVGRGSVIEIDEPLVARREWMRYFLGEWETEPVGTTPDATPGTPSTRRARYLLLDRRRPDQAVKITGPVTLDFALAPVASTLAPVR